MMKSLAAIVIAVAAALVSDAPVAGNPRDLWIGVVGFSDPYREAGSRGPIALDPSTSLEPVAALVGGRWWFTSDDGYTENETLRETGGKVPAQWLPPGMALPSSWQAHLFDRRRVPLRTSGPLYARREELVVRTDFKLPRANWADTDEDAKGIAVSGDLRVQFFADLPESRQAELLRFFAATMLAAERAEIQLHAASDADRELLLSQVASRPLKTDLAKTATQRGAPVYVIEGSKLLGAGDAVGLVHTGAAAERDRAGALHLLGTWSYFNFNDEAHGNRPLAVFERNGGSCWLIGHTLEGGVKYVLTRPGQIDPKGLTFTCDIK